MKLLLCFIRKNLLILFFFQINFSLLQTASSIIAPGSATDYTQQQHQVKAKRILYVKSIVRLLRLCGSKYQQLLTTSDGSKSFHLAIFNLLRLIDEVVKKGKHSIDGTFFFFF